MASERHKELIVHVDDLRIHDAFSVEIFDTAQGTAYVTPRDLPPPLGYNTIFPKYAKSLQPAIDNLCLAHVPLFKPEDFVIAKALGAWTIIETPSRCLNEPLGYLDGCWNPSSRECNMSTFDLTASSKVRKVMMSWVRQYVRPSKFHFDTAWHVVCYSHVSHHTIVTPVPPRGSGRLLLHRFHHGDVVVRKQVQVFVAYSFGGLHSTLTMWAHLPYCAT